MLHENEELLKKLEEEGKNQKAEKGAGSILSREEYLIFGPFTEKVVGQQKDNAASRRHP